MLLFNNETWAHFCWNHNLESSCAIWELNVSGPWITVEVPLIPGAHSGIFHLAPESWPVYRSRLRLRVPAGFPDAESSTALGRATLADELLTPPPALPEIVREIVILAMLNCRGAYIKNACC